MDYWKTGSRSEDLVSAVKILVSRLRFIGDIVLTTPVIEALRKKFPDSTIDYLGDKHGVTLLANNPYLDMIIPYDFESWEVAEQIKVVRFLKKKSYDVAIDLFGNPRSAIVVLLSGAKMRIGGAFGWRRRVFTHPITVTDHISAVSFHLRYLAPLGINEDYRPPRIYLTESERVEAVRYLTSLGLECAKPIVGLHLGATWPAKVWQAESYARLADLLQDDIGAQIVVTYGPKDVRYLEAFANSTKCIYKIVHPGGLRRLASMISCFDLYVSNDAAPMHISAAVGIPTIGIFGPGNPDIWFPYERNLGQVPLKKEVGCCGKDHCDFKGAEYMKCMKSMSPGEVFDQASLILKTTNVPGSKVQ